MDCHQLIKKYNVPAPRYTSYPTVPFWETMDFSVEAWKKAIKNSFKASNINKGISIYIHLPFCESLCTFCACNKRITKNHDVEGQYIEALLAEWDLYLDLWQERPVLRELHLGGGTPTFFSPQNLQKLIEGILNRAGIHPKREFGFEGHPNNTTKEHLQVLYDLGFRRVSFGIQDVDEKVQFAINRIQPTSNVTRVTREARAIGYTSVNFDIIYGLPFQTLSSIEKTMELVEILRPERIAFYSYAHVPWKSPGQRRYTGDNIPDNESKRDLYELGKQLLLQMGYHEIGMDHFSLAHDGLYIAKCNGRLHRNFMGYTTSQTDLLVGLGASAIGDAQYAYTQNEKKVEDYQQAVFNHRFPAMKGHLMTEEDVDIKLLLLNLICNEHIPWKALKSPEIINKEALKKLLEMKEEGMIRQTENGFKVTEKGKPFIRNICMIFDKKLQREEQREEAQFFSKAI